MIKYYIHRVSYHISNQSLLDFCDGSISVLLAALCAKLAGAFADSATNFRISKPHPSIHRLGLVGSYISVKSMYNWRFRRPELIKNTSGKAVYLTSPQSQYLCHIGLASLDVLGCHQCSYIVVGFRHSKIPETKTVLNSAVTLNLEQQRCSEGNLVLRLAIKLVQYISIHNYLIIISFQLPHYCFQTANLQEVVVHPQGGFSSSSDLHLPLITRSWYNNSLPLVLVLPQKPATWVPGGFIPSFEVNITKKHLKHMAILNPKKNCTAKLSQWTIHAPNCSYGHVDPWDLDLWWTKWLIAHILTFNIRWVRKMSQKPLLAKEKLAKKPCLLYTPWWSNDS